MRFQLLLWATALLITQVSCNDGNQAPDVSALKAETELRRFDRDFFSIDTLHTSASLQALRQQYPQFLDQYLAYVLGISAGGPQAEEAVAAFIRSYWPVYESGAKVVEAHGKEWQAQVQQSLRYWQYYFPERVLEQPFELVCFVGPMDALEPFSIGDYGDVRTSGGAGIALQFHLGNNDPVYENGMQAGVLFDYQVRRFIPATAPVNVVKNIIEDAFPYPTSGLGLVEEMIEKGKRLYVLDKLMPETADTLKLGYTKGQLAGCFENEALIWNYFVKNDLLFSRDPSLNQLYIKDGPKTQELGEGAPGYIGLFTGRQIVRAFMQKQTEISLEKMMLTPAKEIFEKAAYKP